MLTLFDAFPSAEELGRAIGVPGVTVRQWRNRGSIPPKYWKLIQGAAKERGTDLPLETFLPGSAPDSISVSVADSAQ